MAARPGMMKLGTFCSGIGAPEMAGMGEPLWFCEIDRFACAVLERSFPGIPNLGDMTAGDLVARIAGIGLPDVVVAGLPCQPYSVAGQRRGREDERDLTDRFVELADAIDDLRQDRGEPPVWWLVENVPGIFTQAGNPFGHLLGGLVGDGATLVGNRRWTHAGVVAGPRRTAAWRVFDAQYFGLAQRRQRVFVLSVGGARAWRCADALLPVGQGLSGHPPPRRQAGQDIARPLASCPEGGSRWRGDVDTADSLIASGQTARYGKGPDSDCTDTLIAYGGNNPAGPVAHSLRAEGFDAGEDGTGRGTPLVPVAFHARQDPDSGQVTHPLDQDGHSDAVAFSCKDHGADAGAVATPLRTLNHDRSHANAGGQVAVVEPTMRLRRITPKEAERLMGLPDDFTKIPWRGKPAEDCPDGPRYRALGNSMAVPVVRWIGERIQAFEDAVPLPKSH